MSRSVIQIGDDLVAYDGRDWTPVRGEFAEDLARLMKMSEWLYKLEARAHPNFAHDVARAAAKDWHGQIVEYYPDPPIKHDPNILY